MTKQKTYQVTVNMGFKAYDKEGRIYNQSVRLPEVLKQDLISYLTVDALKSIEYYESMWKNKVDTQKRDARAHLIKRLTDETVDNQEFIPIDDNERVLLERYLVDQKKAGRVTLKRLPDSRRITAIIFK